MAHLSVHAVTPLNYDECSLYVSSHQTNTQNTTTHWTSVVVQENLHTAQNLEVLWESRRGHDKLLTYSCLQPWVTLRIFRKLMSQHLKIMTSPGEFPYYLNDKEKGQEGSPNSCEPQACNALRLNFSCRINMVGHKLHAQESQVHRQ